MKQESNFRGALNNLMTKKKKPCFSRSAHSGMKTGKDEFNTGEPVTIFGLFKYLSPNTPVA